MAGTQRGSIASPALYTKLLVLQLIVGAGASAGAFLLGHGKLEPGPSTTLMGYAAVAIAAAIVGYVLVRLKPALPRPEPGDTADRYLASPANLGAAMQMWLLTGGSGLMCWFGPIYTGNWAAAAGGVAVIVVYGMLRPAALIAR